MLGSLGAASVFRVPAREGRMSKPIVAILGLGCAMFTATTAFAIDPFPGRLPGVNIGNRLPDGFESSGALWHPALERLFIVHDEGWIAAMDADGDDVEIWRCPGDLEAITMIDPKQDSGVVYIGVERPDAIKAFDLEEGEVIGSWDLTAWMRGPENRGLEALTFIPDEYLPDFPLYNDGRGSRYGTPGFFYAGLEADGRIYVFDVDLEHSGVVSHVRTMTPVPGRAFIAGLYFHESTQLVYAMFNGVDRVFVMTTAGKVLHEWQMPRGYLEGITIRSACDEDEEEAFLVIPDDAGPVWRFRFYAADPDEDGDRVPDCRDLCPGTPRNVLADENGCVERDP